MPLTELSAATAGVLFALYLVASVFADTSRRKRTWLFPAALSIAFLAFSVVTVVTEGPTGFWPVHTQSLWGNQVWFDLLLAAGIGWSLLVPQAKAVGMRPLLWLVLVVSTGCIGLLAMVARVNYLHQHGRGPTTDKRPTPAADP